MTWLRPTTLAAAAFVVVAAPARAQQSATVRLDTSTRQVEAGEPFVVRLTALSEDGATAPRLETPAGVLAHGPTVGTQQQVSIVNGRVERRQGITASWTVTAAQPGRYRIGPGSVTIGGARQQSQIVVVEVVAPGTAQRARPRDPFGGFPFDPFGMPRLRGFPFDDDLDEPTLDDVPEAPEELRVDRARDPLAFLDARVDERQVVVGEQITYDVLAYGSRGPFREVNSSEPSRTDFVSYPLMEDAQLSRLQLVRLDDKLWHAARVRQLALFPIRTGDLTIGPMSMGFDGRGYPAGASHRGLMRQSQPITVRVVEPPLAGRPPGYKLGDVGRFRLTATVEPKTVEVGESVSVSARLEGTGSLPYTLRTPQQHGVEWLEPTVVDKIEAQDGRIGGFRQFTYVVRVNEPGDVKLGALTLPYWDPELRRYEIARAELGTVKVAGTRPAAPSRTPNEAPEALERLLTPRARLGAWARAPRPWTEEPWFWAALVAPALSVVVAAGAARGGRRLAARLRSQREQQAGSPTRLLGEAEQKVSAGEKAAAATLVERALFAQLEHRYALRARGMLRRELVPALVERGIATEIAEGTAELLEHCDALRFTGAATDAELSSLVPRARELVRALDKSPAGARRSA